MIKTQQVYFICPFHCRLKLGKSLQTSCVNFFFAWADILSEKNPYFGKHLLAKQEMITGARLRVQDFVTGKNVSFNQSHDKEFYLIFFSGRLFYKSNRKLFSGVCIAWSKHSRGWENSSQLCKPETKSRVCITVENSPNPSCVYIRLCKQGKCFLLLKCNSSAIFLWMTMLQQTLKN